VARPSPPGTAATPPTLTIERIEPPSVFGYTWPVHGLPDGDPRRADQKMAYSGNTEGWTNERVSWSHTSMDKPDRDAVADPEVRSAGPCYPIPGLHRQR
jgi:hypothetical protein